MTLADAAVSRHAAEDGDEELFAWPGEVITHNESVLGEPILTHLQEQRRSYMLRTLLFRDGGFGRGT